MENGDFALVLVIFVVVSYFFGFVTCRSYMNFKKNIEELEEKLEEDDKCCGCKYCNKNK